MIKKKSHNRSGQTLLIVLLLTTVLLAIGLSVAQNTRQEAQFAQIEADAKKAFAAAEAGLEAALERGSTNVSDLAFKGIKSIDANYVDETTKDFVTPRILKDSQFTFYLSGYDESTKSVVGTSYAGILRLETVQPDSSLCSDDTTKYALELTLVNTVSGSEGDFRRMIDPCDIVEGTDDEWDFDTTYTLADEGIGATILFMRAISEDPAFSGAKVKLSRTDVNWPSQGKVLVSRAETTTGVVKTIRLFQSYPQIPSDFFVTSF